MLGGLDEAAQERLGVNSLVEDEVTAKVGAAIDELKNILNFAPEPIHT